MADCIPLSSIHRMVKVLDALLSGHDTTAKIAAATRYSANVVYRAIYRLEREGALRRVRPGLQESPNLRVISPTPRARTMRLAYVERIRQAETVPVIVRWVNPIRSGFHGQHGAQP